MCYNNTCKTECIIFIVVFHLHKDRKYSIDEDYAHPLHKYTVFKFLLKLLFAPYS